mgnify:CR=1 FL=1
MNNNSINISNEKITFFKNCFDTFDTDKDGFIGLNFIMDLLKNVKIDLDQNEYQNFVNELDFEKSGKINFDEFILLILRKYKEGPVNEVDDYKDSFNFISNGKDKLNKERLRNLFDVITSKCGMDSKITDDELNEMFKEANYGDENSEINFESFLKYINK